MSYIDRQRLEHAILTSRPEGQLRWLLRAVAVLPETELRRVFHELVPWVLMDDAPETMPLLQKVREFERGSLAGEYFQPVYGARENPAETVRWIAEFSVLLELSLALGEAGQHRDANAAQMVLFGLLREIEDCRIDIVEFADEAGAWQVGVAWKDVLPKWARSAATLLEADEFRAQLAVVAPLLYPSEREECLEMMEAELLPDHAQVLREALGR